MDYLKYTKFIKNKTFQKCALGGLTIFTILGGIGYLVKNEILSNFEKKEQEQEKIKKNTELDEYIKELRQNQEIMNNEENNQEENNQEDNNQEDNNQEDNKTLKMVANPWNKKEHERVKKGEEEEEDILETEV